MKASGIKVITVDGKGPSAEAVRDHVLALRRPTYYYTNGDPAGLAKAFIEFTLGPAGQKIAENVGFVPVK